MNGIEAHLGVFSLHLAGASSILGVINFIVTIYGMRAPGLFLYEAQFFYCYRYQYEQML